jgi:hypothetical protein
MKTSSLVAAFAIVVLIVSTNPGCATAPVQEMSDARQAIASAREAGANEHAPEDLASAEQRLADAEKALRAGDYEQARTNALAAKEEAFKARNLAVSLGDGG